MKKHKLIVKNVEVLQGTNDIKVMLSLPISQNNAVQALQGEYINFNDKAKLLTAEIQPYSPHRSLTANGYMWTLLDKIAKHPSIKSTKEELYRNAIRQVGIFEIVPIKSNAVESYINRWNSQGLGWLAEKLEHSKLKGYEKVITYFGSSTYTRAEMAIFIDFIVDQAKELDIETITPQEQDKMLKMIKE